MKVDDKATEVIEEGVMEGSTPPPRGERVRGVHSTTVPIDAGTNVQMAETG